ncbi:MAG: hypothetical protein WCJ54_04365 [Actinomycetota bacterium]
MNELKSIIPKDWLPPCWEEISREESDTQIIIKIGHIDPENNADPLLTSGNPTAIVDGEAVTVHAVSTRGTMAKFFETMTKMAALGWMQGYTPEMIQQIRGQFNQIKNEKYDTSADLVIVKYPDEKSAAQTIQNQITIRTQGLGAMVIPGTDGKLQNYLENEAVLKFMTAEQIELLKVMIPKMQEQQKDAFQTAGMNYSVGEYLSCPAAIMEMDNPAYKTFVTPKPKTRPDPKAFHGGGFDPLAGKGILPERPLASPPPETIKSYMAIQVKKYVISGSLIASVEMLPDSNTFCEALTKYKIYVETEKVEGQTYTTKHLVPVASNYASEGYINKEEVEKILAGVISRLLQ